MYTTNLEHRVTIVTLAKARHTDSDIAERSGWSVSTVRRWCRLEAKQGLKGLASQMGPPGRPDTVPDRERLRRSYRQLRLRPLLR